MFALTPLFAAPKSKQVPAPIEPPIAVPGPSKSTLLYEFRGDQLSLVLRALAHDARVRVDIDESVTGDISMRLEDTPPMEAIEILAVAKELIIDKDKRGVLHIRAKNPPPPKAEKAEPAQDFGEAFIGAFMPAILGMYDAVLDFQAKAETAQKVAKGKKLLYDAFIAQGFTKEEAFQLVLVNQDYSMPDFLEK